MSLVVPGSSYLLRIVLSRVLKEIVKQPRSRSAGTIRSWFTRRILSWAMKSCERNSVPRKNVNQLSAIRSRWCSRHRSAGVLCPRAYEYVYGEVLLSPPRERSLTTVPAVACVVGIIEVMQDTDWRWRVRVALLGVLLAACVLVWWPAVGGAVRGPHARSATSSLFSNQLVASALGWWGSVTGASAREPLLTVAFLDIGQGDAIYIETFDGVQLLIDGGPNASILRELATVMPWLDRSLDVVLATHYDLDHIGGLVDVLSRYDVGMVVKTTNNHDTTASRAFRAAVADSGAPVHYALAGDVLALGASTTFRIISPASDPTNWESNNASIVGVLTFGAFDVMLTGDAGVTIEDYLVRTHGTALQSEVLKFGHHGSRTSSSELFVTTVAPQVAVVSAGRNNRYGHPHAEVVARAKAIDAQVLSTAEQGTLIFRSNGREFWIDK